MSNMSLADFNMHELEGTLLQRLPDHTTMQVRLEPDRVGVSWRKVDADTATVHRVISDWNSAYERPMADWIINNSPVWDWLKAKGIDEAAALLRAGGLKTS